MHRIRATLTDAPLPKENDTMITVDDCIHFSSLDSVDIEAIAVHEHVGEILACELAAELSTTPRGCRTIIKFFVDDIRAAEAHHQYERARRLHLALNHFSASHRYI